jgi:hypothetical protein
MRYCFIFGTELFPTPAIELEIFRWVAIRVCNLYQSIIVDLYRIHISPGVVEFDDVVLFFRPKLVF